MTDTSAYRPKLREDVELREDPPGAVLACPCTGFAIRLTETWERALPPLLDGTRTLEDLGDAVARALDAPTDQLDARLRRLVKSLRFMRLTDDADRAALARIQAARRHPEKVAENAPLRALPDARFSCNGSGMCCRGHRLGPLDAHDLGVLERLPLRETFPVLRERPPLQRVATSGGAGVAIFLNTTDDGRCVFLAPDERCGIHREFGAEAKPGFCRLFPHDVVMTTDAVYVVDRVGCACYGKTAFAGPPLAEVVRADPDLFRGAAALGPLAHRTVAIDEDLHADMALTHPVELLMAKVAEHPVGTVRDAVMALKRVVETLREAVLEADDAVETPRAIAERVASLPPASFYATPAPDALDDRRAGLGALAALLERAAFLGERAQAAAHGLPRGVAAKVRALGRAAEAGTAAVGLCRAAAAGREPEPGSPAALAATVPFAVEDHPEHDHRLRRLLRDLVFARLVVLGPSLPRGVAYLAALIALIATGGRLEAARAGRAEVATEDLDRAQHDVLGLMRFADVKDHLLRHESARAAYDRLAPL